MKDKRRRMFYKAGHKLLFLVTVLVIIGIFTFGLIKRSTYTDLCGDPSFPTNMLVAEMPEQIAVANCAEMEKNLPNSPVILSVEAEEETEFRGAVARQKMLVRKVHAGEGLQEGDEIYITGRTNVSLAKDDPYKSLECWFVNIPKPGKVYLIFLESEVDAVHETLPVWKVSEEPFFNPIFCYEEFPNVIAPLSGKNTYVSYEAVKDNEFFAASETGYQAFMKLKKALLAKYPL